jgi:hypothetical protein
VAFNPSTGFFQQCGDGEFSVRAWRRKSMIFSRGLSHFRVALNRFGVLARLVLTVRFLKYITPQVCQKQLHLLQSPPLA